MIRHMKEDERNQVACFVAQMMRERYGSEAYMLPELVYTAWYKDGLLGAMAVATSNGEPFHLENLYALDYRTFPDVFDRLKIVQLGRLAAKAPNISGALIYACILDALRSGHAWGIGELKPYVARRFARMGVTIHVLSGKPVLENIPADALPYYLVPPSPMPAAMSLAHAEAALRPKVASLVAAGDINLQSP